MGSSQQTRKLLVALLSVAALFVFFASTIQAETPEGAEYIGNAQCKVCHNKTSTGAQWTVWSKMAHAQAFKTLEGDEAKKIAADRGLTTPPSEAPECLRCHVTAYDVETKKAPDAITMADGIQCETCHGPASIHKDEGRKAMFAKGEEKVDMSQFLHKPVDQDCRKCHNEESPTWDPEKFTLEDGTKVGFDFEQAAKKIAHPNPLKHPETTEAPQE